MNPTLNLITYIEGLVAIVAQSVTAIKGAISNGTDPTTALSDADTAYQALIAAATQPPAPPAT